MARIPLYKNGTSESRLTDRMRRFVFEYVIDYDGSRAAQAAGYKNPGSQACRLLKNPLVAHAVGKIHRQTLKELELRREDVIEQIKFNVLRDPLDLCDEDGVIIINDMRKLPRRMRCCIDGIKCKQDYNEAGKVVGQTIELKMVSKHAQIELAAKMFGMLTDRQEINQKVTIDWNRLLTDNRDQPNVVEGKIVEKEQGDVTTPGAEQNDS